MKLLTHLPVNCFLNLVSYLDYSDLARLSRVNRRLKDLVQSILHFPRPGSYPKKMIERTFKIALVGPYTSGKDSLLLRYLDDEYRIDTPMNTPMDFKFMSYKIDTHIFKVLNFILQYGVRCRSNTVTKAYLKGLEAIIIVLDVKEETSILVARKFIKKVKKQRAEVNGSMPFMMLVSTKNDCLSGKVSHEEAQALAFEYHLDYYATSAKNNEGVNEVFENCLASLLRQYPFSSPKKSLNAEVCLENR